MNPLRRYLRWLHLRWPAGWVEKLPRIAADGTTAVPGVRVVGDLTGVPLLKFAADSGARAAAAIADELGADAGGEAGPVDLAIVGGGVAGIAAALEAQQRGLRFVVFEASEPFTTVANFPRGKPIFTYPAAMKPAGPLEVTATVKEDLWAELERQRCAAGVEPKRVRIERLERKGGLIRLHHGEGEPFVARRVIVAIGRTGNHRRLAAPGAESDKVFNRLHDPGEFTGRNVVVVGGGDSALEAAVALVEANARVTLVHRGSDFPRAKPENVAALTASAVSVRREATVVGIEPGTVTLRTPAGEERLENDTVFTLIGREAPLDFFRRSGIPIAGETRWPGWLGLAAMLLACGFVYTWKGGGPTESWINPAAWATSLSEQWNDRSTVLGTIAISMHSRSFYYTLLYSLVVLAFGVDRIRRRRTPYVRRQTITLILIQWLPLFVLPEIVLPWAGYNGAFSGGGVGEQVADALFEKYDADEYALEIWPDDAHPRAYWRAYGFILAWPLNVYNVFDAYPRWAWLVIAFLQTFVLIPWLVWRWGKGAYCGWICSCGGLAETLGDRHREKMPHGPGWNRVNVIGQVFLAIAFALLAWRILGWVTLGSWVDHSFRVLSEGKTVAGATTTTWFLSYKWFIDVLFAGIIGVGFYFKYSGRVWCRFACPLAALMHIYARFTRFRIFARKEKCISCNVCTTVCHQGIDVMAFANRGAPMEDPQCVRCSACVQSCPTGVLSFGRLLADGRPVFDALPASPVQMMEARNHTR